MWYILQRTIPNGECMCTYTETCSAHRRGDGKIPQNKWDEKIKIKQGVGWNYQFSGLSVWGFSAQQQHPTKPFAESGLTLDYLNYSKISTKGARGAPLPAAHPCDDHHHRRWRTRTNVPLKHGWYQHDKNACI